MALNVQMYKVHNYLTNEDIVMARLVNQQVLDFNALCDYLADGSTVTAGDVAAVMKQIEMRLPLILGLNAKVVCSPEGLTFRPKVSGSITQKQLKAKLQAKLDADPSADIDVNRELTVSDLSVSDLTAEIGIELPKKWTERFQSKAEFKRIRVENPDGNENDNANVNVNDNDNENENENDNPNLNTGGDENDNENENPNLNPNENTGGGDNPGGGDDGEDED